MVQITVGTVIANGNSVNTSTYQFADAGKNSISKPKVYYRLQERSRDGNNTYSKVITLTLSGPESFTIKALSNPVTNMLPLQVSSFNEKITLRIVDAAEKMMRSQQTINGNGIITLSLSELKNGVYTLIAESMNERKIIRFVKQ